MCFHSARGERAPRSSINEYLYKVATYGLQETQEAEIVATRPRRRSAGCGLFRRAYDETRTTTSDNNKSKHPSRPRFSPCSRRGSIHVSLLVAQLPRCYCGYHEDPQSTCSLLSSILCRKSASGGVAGGAGRGVICFVLLVGCCIPCDR